MRRENKYWNEDRTGVCKICGEKKGDDRAFAE
jgi:hypothetical protein